ncbi:hypothetical protein evm_005403 [Chilo suppressalis]|nr:hypothetical protein evm_005403 [Chilo suppressalis]
MAARFRDGPNRYPNLTKLSASEIKALNIIRRGKMNILPTFMLLLFAGLACSTPVGDADTLVINEKSFIKDMVIYTSENDIIKLLTPLNKLNFNEDDDEESGENLYIFFVEGEKDAEGKVDYKGLYVLKNGVASKVLDNGKDMAAPSGDNKKVFLASSDGIYLYNVKTNGAEKYGTINEDIVGIEVENGTDVMYILTNDKKVYRVTEEGTVKEQLDKIQNAQQIVVDWQNNLFYLDTDNQVYVYSEEEVKKVEGLPRHPSYVQLTRPPFVLDEGVPVIAGKKAFTATPDGKSEYAQIIMNVHPTAYSMEAALIHYYAYNKKIYEFNILSIILTEMVEGIKSFFEDKVDQIQTIATRSIGEILA